MKRFVYILLMSLLICSFAYAQTFFDELDKAKKLILLESTKEDARNLFVHESFFENTAQESDEEFNILNSNISVSYSSGSCANEDEAWNVSEGKITGIRISPKDRIELKNIGIDSTNFRKERIYHTRKHYLVYFDKAKGIAIVADHGIVHSIDFTPPKTQYLRACDKKKAKEYFSSKKWNSNPPAKDVIVDFNFPANVVDLMLDRAEITTGCVSSENAESAFQNLKIGLSAIAVDPDNDPLTYYYKISVGKIIGRGANVVWDLSDVKAGKYMITAAVDDGCGFCGRFVTKTIFVKECSGNVLH